MKIFKIIKKYDIITEENETKKIKVELCLIKYTNNLLEKNSNKLFIFEDSALNKVYGSQDIIKNNFNTFKIITKRFSNNNEESFLNDEMYNVYVNYINEFIKMVKYILKINNNYNVLVFPYKGLGKGLADMPNKAPKCFEYMKNKLKEEFNYEF